MDISFNCPLCNQHLAVDQAGAGMTVNCPNCNERIVIPRDANSPPPVRLVAATTPKPHSASGAPKYVGSYLMPGENVVYHTQLHWAVFLPCLTFSAFALLLFLSGIFSGANGLVFLAGVPALIVLPLAISSMIAQSTSEFAVTNKRVLIKVGWLRRHSLETLLTKIETIRVEQGILGRALDYGTIVISGTGGSKEPFRTIASPMEFRRKVQEQIAATAGRA
jgi:membrane protein YdbS with pleckstrin-like domain/DNA-directed RNA polymerase subunit RPC12/RpoP